MNKLSGHTKQLQGKEGKETCLDVKLNGLRVQEKKKSGCKQNHMNASKEKLFKTKQLISEN